MPYEISCGAVVFTRRDEEVFYVIIQSRRGHYDFPKGHVEAGETEEETALREIWEETGLRPTLLPGFRETNEYPLPDKPGVMKRVVYFLAQYEGQTLRFQPEELLGAQLLSYDEVLRTITFENSRQILRAAQAHIERAI